MIAPARLALCSAAVALLGGEGSANALSCPNVMFVLDQSGSMDADPNGNYPPRPPLKSMWELQEAAVQAVLSRYGDQLPFGLQLFTSNGSDDAACYDHTNGKSLEPDHDTRQKILQTIADQLPKGGTNTGDAIRRVGTLKSMRDTNRAQYIVLITDGDPRCNGGEPTYTYNQLKALRTRAAAPIMTFVVGFDGTGGVDRAKLNRMAQEGGVPRAGCDPSKDLPCYYSASNAQSLNAALAQIIQVVMAGEFGMVMCDDSCFSNGCKPGEVCSTDELNPRPRCVPDPCAGGLTCAEGEYCRAGLCVPPCPRCAAGQKCLDGSCVNDPCTGQDCGGDPTLACDPNTGNCVPSPCDNVKCVAPTVCEPSTGNCLDDACRLITCPPGTLCRPGGNCEALLAPDLGVGGRTGPGNRGAGVGACAVSSEPGRPDSRAAITLLAGLALALVARRRRR